MFIRKHLDSSLSTSDRVTIFFVQIRYIYGLHFCQQMVLEELIKTAMELNMKLKYNENVLKIQLQITKQLEQPFCNSTVRTLGLLSSKKRELKWVIGIDSFGQESQNCEQSMKRFSLPVLPSLPMMVALKKYFT